MHSRPIPIDGPRSSSRVRRAFARATVLLVPLASCAPSGAPGGAEFPRAARPLRADTLEHAGWGRACDLVHSELDLAILFDQRAIEGSVRHRIRALVDGTDEMELHAVDLELGQIRDGEGRPLEHRVQGDLVTIELAEPLSRGAELEVVVPYRGSPVKGLYFKTESKFAEGFQPEVWSQGQDEDTRHWIPIWDYPNERASFEGHFRLPHGMQGISNGVLLEVEDHGGGERTFHWRMDDDQPTYLIALAAGRWEHYADEWRGIPVDYYVGPGTGEERARRAFGETPLMLEYFSNQLEMDYPYPKYAQAAVADFLYGGMENTTITIQNDYIVGDADEIADLEGDPRLLVAHEAAHQWFGNRVTCFGWSNMWLNEAWASYLELLFHGHMDGQEEVRVWLERYRDIYLLRDAQTRLPLAESWRARASNSRYNHVYDKGPWVLYMLHRELGDGPFWQSVRDYLDIHEDRLVTGEDFARAFFDSCGANIHPHLQQWVYGAGHPEYRVDFDLRRARSGEGPLKLRVRQTQRVDDLVPLFDEDVSVEVLFEGGRAMRRSFRIDRADETFEVPIRGPVVDLRFDADCDVLCTLDLRKDVEMWAVQALDGTNSAGRYRAIPALNAGLRGTSKAVAQAALLRILQGDAIAHLRARAAIHALFPAAIPALVEGLASDDSPHVREACVISLARLGPGEATRRRCAELLELERSPKVRALLGEWLGLDTEGDGAE